MRVCILSGRSTLHPNLCRNERRCPKYWQHGVRPSRQFPSWTTGRPPSTGTMDLVSQPTICWPQSVHIRTDDSIYRRWAAAFVTIAAQLYPSLGGFCPMPRRPMENGYVLPNTSVSQSCRHLMWRITCGPQLPISYKNRNNLVNSGVGGSTFQSVIIQ